MTEKTPRTFCARIGEGYGFAWYEPDGAYMWHESLSCPMPSPVCECCDESLAGPGKWMGKWIHYHRGVLTLTVDGVEQWPDVLALCKQCARGFEEMQREKNNETE